MTAPDSNGGAARCVLTAVRVRLTCSAVLVAGSLAAVIARWTTGEADAGVPAPRDLGHWPAELGTLFVGFVGATTAAFLQREQSKKHRRELSGIAAAEKVRSVEGCFFHLLASLH